MTLLYSGLDPSDSGQIVQRMDAQGVPYELRGDGSQIYVPQDQVAKLRLSLASEGIPAGGSIGYEIFDRADALGTTNFVQQINQIRALEGELARTIRSIHQVRSARVHLVMPKRELFSRDRAGADRLGRAGAARRPGQGPGLRHPASRLLRRPRHAGPRTSR